MMGYAHRRYAHALSCFGTPIELTSCRGWLLKRAIPRSNRFDAIGPYPIFACRDWTQVGADLKSLWNEDLVSVALVCDPFGDYSLSDLHDWFDCVAPFKRHFVIDLRLLGSGTFSRHHRYYARKAARIVSVEVCAEPPKHEAEFSSLYEQLVRRKELDGISAFSRWSLQQQLNVPGMILFRATYRGELAGMHICLEGADRAYSHLTAINDLGRRSGASYALYAAAIEYFRSRVRWFSLGGSAGVVEQADGLSFFKRGWSNETRMAYFCGKISDERQYAKLVDERNLKGWGFFPAYRNGEF